MQVVTVQPNSPDRVFAYEIEQSLSENGNGSWILIPEDVITIAVSISFTDGGRGKVETTTDIVSNVKNDIGVVPVDWALGVVNDTIQDSVIPVTAIRLVQTSLTGSSKLTVRAQ